MTGDWEGQVGGRDPGWLTRGRFRLQLRINEKAVAGEAVAFLGAERGHGAWSWADWQRSQLAEGQESGSMCLKSTGGLLLIVSDIPLVFFSLPWTLQGPSCLSASTCDIPSSSDVLCFMLQVAAAFSSLRTWFRYHYEPPCCLLPSSQLWEQHWTD